ncbi:MAG: hypothetical protein PHR28_13435 [candidate division Zixibacteria bacterium]|nr:hypothetical protein [candidate division Zixibacteria bacterium]
MRTRFVAIVALILLAFVSCVAAGGPANYPSGQEAIEAAASKAMAAALAYAGFDKLKDSAGILISPPELIALEDETTPFISGMIAGEKVWRVTMRQVPITCGLVQKYRDFNVYLDSSTYRLVFVYSASIDAGTADTLPELPAATYETRLQGDSNRFGGFPDQPPAWGLVQVLCSCFDNPFNARVIKAIYLDFAAYADQPQQTWMVILRGLDPPPICAGPVEGNVPVSERNMSWNIIDANTGKLRYMMSSPIKVTRLKKE